MFDVLILIIVLSVLVFVHELGHFVTAKRAGMKVEEFGFGFPPRLFGWKRGETTYSINWIPFGGFVKIFGEDDNQQKDPRAFASKPAFTRARVIVAGVAMNILLAVILLGILEVQIVGVVPDSPATQVGLKSGDEIVGFKTDGEVRKVAFVQEVAEIVKNNAGKEIEILIRRDNRVVSHTVTPRVNQPENQGALGINMELKVSWDRPDIALWRGLQNTWYLLSATVMGFASLFKNLFTHDRAGVELTGPVGIAKIAGDIARVSFVYLLQFSIIPSPQYL